MRGKRRDGRPPVKSFVAGAACALSFILVACTGLGKPDLYTIGVFQFAANGQLDATRDGFVQGMQDAGYDNGANVRYEFHNAHGDVPTAQLIARQLESGAVDLVVAMGTPALQAVLNDLSTKPVVFGSIANPYILGAGESADEHLPLVTGATGAAPSGKALKLMVELLPAAQRVGVVHDPGLVNSVYNLEVAQQAADELGLELVMASVVNSGEVQAAAQALSTKGIDAFLVFPDHHVMDAVDAIAGVGAARGIPVFTSVTDLVAGGAAVGVGWDYHENGRLVAEMVLRILDGEALAEIPFQQLEKTLLCLNLPSAGDQGLVISDELVARADEVIE